MIYTVYKKLGETPLECLERTRVENNISKDISMTFAGRLDPAAEGEIIIITDNDIKNKEDYLKKDKVYIVEFVLSISTDSGDLLGLITNNIDPNKIIFDKNDLQNTLNQLTGTRNQEFHAFSSKVVDGKPMWQHAKEGNSVSASHEITINSIKILSQSELSGANILKRVQHVISLVTGDFRQNEVLESFKVINLDDVYTILKLEIHASSGTYMRVLGEELGKLLKIPICAYSIVRTSVVL